ncbi:Uncharacterized protein dnm_074210 [Desulfonema magnum]|uniref:Uncharacterized protein n=1 Tax=Desulfonema magnum TaxID=45655 RepID=A0A975BTH8_9BACT|nr:Uncharacterized protein dnm_074210 [Desulfonema magnum]
MLLQTVLTFLELENFDLCTDHMINRCSVRSLSAAKIAVLRVLLTLAVMVVSA